MRMMDPNRLGIALILEVVLPGSRGRELDLLLILLCWERPDVVSAHSQKEKLDGEWRFLAGLRREKDPRKPKN